MRLKSFIIGDLVYGAVLAAALVALGIGFTLTSSTGEQSKLAYEGDLWCVSNYIEARDSNNQPIYLEDGRPRKDERLDDRTDWIRKEQVAADSAQEAEQIARENAKGLFEPSNATELRAALDNNDEAFFKTHYNEGATSAGPCLGSGWGNGMAGKWVNDGINEDCFGLTSDQGCGFDISKLTLYEDKSSGADPGAKNSQKTEARQYAIEVLGIDASQIKQFPKAEVENMIRAEVARQWAEVSNKYGATQEQAQQAILSYQEHEDSRFQLIGSDGLTSYTLASNSDAAALNIMSLTNDKFDSKNKRIAASYDIKYAIYLGVKENMGAFQSSRVTGEGEQRWKNAIGYVFLPSNPQRYWTDSRSNVAERAWEHYSNETAYVCREIDSGTETPKKPDAPEYCPDKPLETGPSSGEDYQLRLAKQYEQELSKVDGIDSNTSGYDEDAGKTIVEIALQYAPGPDGKTKFKYQINSDGPNTFDCSGFVLRCWGFTTHAYSTSTLYLISSQIPWTDLRRGDILNWAGHHVRLFERYDDVDPNKVWVYEATAGVTPARVVHRYVYKSDMVASYVPRRYVWIQEITAADLDRDGDVDLADFGIFQNCFNGPNRPPAQADCGDADLDNDEDVDVADFGIFQGCFNGPNRPPACS